MYLCFVLIRNAIPTTADSKHVLFFRYRRSDGSYVGHPVKCREQFIIKDGVMWRSASSDSDRSGPATLDGIATKPFADDIRRIENDTIATVPHNSPQSRLHEDLGVTELDQTDKSKEKSHWHSPSGLQSWRFTPSPPQEKHHSRQSQQDSTAHRSLPLVVATPHMIAQLQLQMDEEADARWRPAAPVSPVPMRAVHTRLEVTTDDSHQARGRSRRLSEPQGSSAHPSSWSSSKTRSSPRSLRHDDCNDEVALKSARRNTSVADTGNSWFDGLLLSSEHDSRRRRRHLQSRERQNQQSRQFDARDLRKSPHQSEDRSRHHSPQTVQSGDRSRRRQGMTESESELLEEVRKKWQFAHLRSSPHRSSHVGNTTTHRQSVHRFHSDEGAKIALDEESTTNRTRRLAQRSTDAVDEPSWRGSRHWSEAPRWRP